MLTKSQKFLIFLSVLILFPLATFSQSVGRNEAYLFDLFQYHNHYIPTSENFAFNSLRPNNISCSSVKHYIDLPIYSFFLSGSSRIKNVAEIGLEITQFGNETYKEHNIGAEISKSIMKKLFFGIKGGYQVINAVEVETDVTPIVDVAFGYRVSDFFFFGSHTANISKTIHYLNQYDFQWFNTFIYANKKYSFSFSHEYFSLKKNQFRFRNILKRGSKTMLLSSLRLPNFEFMVGVSLKIKNVYLRCFMRFSNIRNSSPMASFIYDYGSAEF